MEMFHAVNRRRFLAAAAGGLLATLPARRVWPVQTASLRRGLGAVGPRWRPTAELLRTLPRLLELAAVPGLALATVDDGRHRLQGARAAPVSSRRMARTTARCSRLRPSENRSSPMRC